MGVAPTVWCMLKYGNAWISCFVGKQLQGVLDGASRHMMNCCKWYDFNFVVNMMVVVHVGRGRNRRERKMLDMLAVQGGIYVGENIEPEFALVLETWH